MEDTASAPRHGGSQPKKGKIKEAAFLKYAEKSKMENIFVPWTAVSHPDFPGKITEVGGIKPFAMVNPPADSLELLISKNYKFIKAVAFMHPELEFLDIKTESAGEGIWQNFSETPQQRYFCHLLPKSEKKICGPG